MKCLKVASYLIRFILQMYNVASGMTECYTAKSDLFDNLWIYVWQADCHQFQTCLVILGSKAMIRMMILMLIPLKGMIESSRQNSCLMCRLSPWLLMTIAECKWVQLTVEFELPQGGKTESEQREAGSKGGHETFMHLGTLCIRRASWATNEVKSRGLSMALFVLLWD